MTSSMYTVCISTLSGLPNRIAISPADAINSVECLQRCGSNGTSLTPPSWSAATLSKTIRIVFRMMGNVHGAHPPHPPPQNDQPKNNTSLGDRREINCRIDTMKSYAGYLYMKLILWDCWPWSDLVSRDCIRDLVDTILTYWYDSTSACEMLLARVVRETFGRLVFCVAVLFEYIIVIKVTRGQYSINN